MTTTQDDIQARPGTGSAIAAFALLLAVAYGAYQLGQRRADLDGLLAAGSNLNAVAVMGPRHFFSNAPDFRSADMAAVMGQSELDLRGADLAGEVSKVDAFVLFGRATLRVPEGWMVECHTASIFGGVENRVLKQGADPAKRVKVTGLIVFGALEISH